jgi:hypothetical protein
MGSTEPWPPRLHDAEVISLHLERSGPTLEIVVALDTQAPGAAPLRLTFEEISELDLTGFNHQNVLFELTASQTGDDTWQVRLLSSHGLGGSFRCARLPAIPIGR